MRLILLFCFKVAFVAPPQIAAFRCSLQPAHPRAARAATQTAHLDIKYCNWRWRVQHTAMFFLLSMYRTYNSTLFCGERDAG